MAPVESCGATLVDTQRLRIAGSLRHRWRLEQSLHKGGVFARRTGIRPAAHTTKATVLVTVLRVLTTEWPTHTDNACTA